MEKVKNIKRTGRNDERNHKSCGWIMRGHKTLTVQMNKVLQIHKIIHRA